jgi:ribose 1,5-bisphosphokinase PhnN
MSSVEPTLIVVSGPPASGKTSVAEELREQLRLPLIAKDTLKETLGEELGVTDREGSHRLGGAVFELMRVLVPELLAQGVSLVVEGNFTVQTRVFDSLPPCRIVQVYVTAEPPVLRDRLLDRGERHSVHYDREAAYEIVQRAEGGEWDPLPLDGPVVRVDTTHGELSDTFKSVRHQLSSLI